MRRLKTFSLNIALLTASFTTGIAAGTGFCQFIWAQSINSQTIACSTASILVTLALTRTCRRRESGGWLVGLYFLVGVLCGCTAVASYHAAPGAGPLQIAAEGFAARFRSMILSLPFPHPESPVLVNALLTGDKSGGQRHNFRIPGQRRRAHIGIVRSAFGNHLRHSEESYVRDGEFTDSEQDP
mgnify:CR=1 FL=1